MATPIRVLITGAAGQVAYSLAYMLARGEVFGHEQPLILHLYDIPRNLLQLDGLAMELTDCGLPLLQEIVKTTNIAVAFSDINVAFMAAGVPCKEGMERKDLLLVNSDIFVEHGGALDKYARKDVLVVVITNPVNTIAMVCARHAPSIPSENFTGLTRLDHNRATVQLASKLDVPTSAIKNVITWGNHSTTQVNDASCATVTYPSGVTKLVSEVINDKQYLRNDFVAILQQRGTEILKLRHKSAAMSAAKAAVDHMHDWWHGTAPGEFVSMAVLSDGSYNTPKNVMFSFPVEISNRQWKIVKGIGIDDATRARLQITSKELIDEREMAFSHCGDSFDEKRNSPGKCLCNKL